MNSAEESSSPWLELPSIGARVTPMTAPETVTWISNSVGKRLLLNHNLHSAFLLQGDKNFAALYQRADRVVIDGMPILAIAALTRNRPLSTAHRIGSTDWIERLSEAPLGGRLLIFGASPRSNRAAVEVLREKLGDSGWSVDGLDGYVPSDEALDWIKENGPTLVLVGLGMPLQERFLQENWNELPPAVFATVGGAIDYVGGQVSLAPRWMGRVGIEWLWRLAHDPRRLAYRYLIEPVLLLRLLLARRFRHVFKDASQQPNQSQSPQH